MEKKQIILDNIPTKYWILSTGDVYSESSNRLLSKRETSGKYLSYNLSVNNAPYSVYLHRLLAEYFIPNPENKAEVNHIDGNRRNNSLSNLEWVTRQENLKHQKENYLYGSPGIMQFDIYGNFIREYRTGSEAEAISGIKQKSISAACNGDLTNSGGFLWCFKGNETSIKPLGLDHKLVGQEINMYDMNENFITSFPNLGEVYRHFGKTDNGSVSQVCKGRKRSIWGHIFKYKNV